MTTQLPDDGNTVHPISRHRRSSMLDRWIKEQQIQPHISSIDIKDIIHADSTLPVSGTPPNAYLAYPDLTATRNMLQSNVPDDVSTVNSYDLLQDDDIPPDALVDLCVSEVPTTPKTHRSHKYSRLPTPSPLRALHLSFRSASPSSPVSRPPSSVPSTPPRMGLFPRSSGHNKSYSQHSRSSSFPIAGQTPSPQTSSPGSHRWRPSVFGHFDSPSSTSDTNTPSDTTLSPSRPSMSSSNTYTSSTATTVERDIHLTAHKVPLVDSIRFGWCSNTSVFKSGSGTASSTSLWSQPTTSSQVATGSITPRSGSSRMPFAPKPNSRVYNSNVNIAANDNVDDVYAPSVKHDMTRPHIVYAPNNHRSPLSRVSFTSLTTRNSKKKKLVITGIGPNDARKFEGVKRWCESFGEVSLITRMPNGDLHVHFRLAEVADTVCRLRAQVYISGVGSVYLSWYTGNKR